MGTESRRKNDSALIWRHFKACSELVGKKYELGGQFDGNKNGIDCLGLVREYVWLMTEHIMPLEYCGEEVKNYVELYKNDKNLWMDNLKKYLSVYLVYEYNTINTVATDILYVKNTDGSNTYALGINAGNASILTVTEEFGVTFSPISMFNIKAHYKCQQQYH